LSLWAALWIVAAAKGGSVTGTVTMKTPAGDNVPAIVVYVTGFTEDATPRHVVMLQRERRFVPDVLAITRGQTVDFSNQDDIWHNVFSVSKARAFDLGMMKKPETKSVTFSKTGVIDIYCNIHPSMTGTILVLPNRAFALVEPGHAYRIDAVPAGDYRIFAWSRRSDVQQRDLHIDEGRTVPIDWQLERSSAETPHKNKYGQEYRSGSGY